MLLNIFLFLSNFSSTSWFHQVNAKNIKNVNLCLFQNELKQFKGSFTFKEPSWMNEGNKEEKQIKSIISKIKIGYSNFISLSFLVYKIYLQLTVHRAEYELEVKSYTKI